MSDVKERSLLSVLTTRANKSQLVNDRKNLFSILTSNPSKSRVVTNLVKAPQKQELSQPVNKLFGREAFLTIGNLAIDRKNLTFEFTVRFDDDPEANESSVTIYNLSQQSVQLINKKDEVTLTAGYNNDTGLILKGTVSSIRNYWDGVDKVTQITVLDYIGSRFSPFDSITYAEGTLSSYIIRDLAEKLKLPIAAFNIKEDYVNKDGLTVEGNYDDELKRQAAICGVSAYILNGNLYVQDIKKIQLPFNFVLSGDSGLIGRPDYFTQEVERAWGRDILKGYKVKSLLQHRITTGTVIQLDAYGTKGTYHTRAGKHIWDGDNFITEIEVIE